MAKKKRVKAKPTKHIHRGVSLGFGRDQARAKARSTVPSGSAKDGETNG